MLGQSYNAALLGAIVILLVVIIALLGRTRGRLERMTSCNYGFPLPDANSGGCIVPTGPGDIRGTYTQMGQTDCTPGTCSVAYDTVDGAPSGVADVPCITASACQNIAGKLPGLMVAGAASLSGGRVPISGASWTPTPDADCSAANCANAYPANIYAAVTDGYCAALPASGNGPLVDGSSLAAKPGSASKAGCLMGSINNGGGGGAIWYDARPPLGDCTLQWRDLDNNTGTITVHDVPKELCASAGVTSKLHPLEAQGAGGALLGRGAYIAPPGRAGWVPPVWTRA